MTALSVASLATLGRRVCAVLAAGSAVLHLMMLGHTGNPVLGAVIAAMALVCLYCGYELWRGGALRTWCVVAVMNLAMIGAHWSLPQHGHGEVSLHAEPVSALMGVATTVSLAEAVIAAAVLTVATRRRAARLF